MSVNYLPTLLLLVLVVVCGAIKGGRGGAGGGGGSKAGGSGSSFARRSGYGSSSGRRSGFNQSTITNTTLGGFGMLSEEDSCSLRCIHNVTMPREISMYVDTAIENVFRSKVTTNLAVIFDPTSVERLCRLSDQYTSCLAQNCSSRGVKSLQALIYEAACNDTKFPQKVGCYKTVYASNADDCDHRRKCQGYKTSSCAPVQQSEAWSDGNKQGDPQRMAQDLMRFKCYYFKCDVECRRNMINSQCGSDAADVLLKFYHRIVTAAKTAVKYGFLMETKQELASYDDTCDKLLLGA